MDFTPGVSYLSFLKTYGILRTGWNYLTKEYVIGVQKFSRNVRSTPKVLGTSFHTEDPQFWGDL
jgi:hypothetical protein